MGLKNSSLYLIGQTRGTPGNSKSSIDRPYEMNRYMGGHRRQNHPFVNGYWYVLIQPPERLFNEAGAYKTAGSIGGEGIGGSPPQAFETSRWLHSTAESFTPPTRTLTKVDVPGMGGMGSSYIAGQQLTRTFTTTHREYQDTPIFNAINKWTSVIDHHYGVSPLEGNEYIPANYKGAAWVFLCKPTVTYSPKGGVESFNTSSGTTVNDNSDYKIDKIDVEQFYFFEGVFPEGSPYDGFNSDINTNDVVQLSQTWSFDGWPYGRENTEAFNKGIELLTQIYDFSFVGTYVGFENEILQSMLSPTNSGASDN